MNILVKIFAVSAVLLVSTAAVADDYDNFSDQILVGYVNVGYDGSGQELSVDLQGFVFGYAHYFDKLTASEYPVNERGFTSRTSSLTAALSSANGNMSILGFDIYDVSSQSFNTQLIYYPSQSSLFGLASVSLEKANANGKNILGINVPDSTNTTRIVGLGAGTYLLSTTAIAVYLGSGKDNTDEDAAAAVPKNRIKIAGLEFKHVAKLTANNTFSLNVGYVSTKTTGEHTDGDTLAENRKSTQLEASYYFDAITSLGLTYEIQKTTDDNDPSADFFGDGKSTGIIFNKYISATTQLRFSYNIFHSDNDVVGDGTSTIIGLSSIF